MAKEKKVIRKKVVVVPKDKAELEQYVFQIREAEQGISAIENKFGKLILELEARINKLNKVAKDETKPYEKLIDELAKGVYIFAEGHRAELTDQGARKTVELAAGNKVRWYFTPPAVEVDEEEEALGDRASERRTKIQKSRRVSTLPTSSSHLTRGWFLFLVA